MTVGTSGGYTVWWYLVCIVLTISDYAGKTVSLFARFGYSKMHNIM